MFLGIHLLVKSVPITIDYAVTGLKYHQHEILALFNSRSDRIDRKFVPSDYWLLMRSAVGQTDLQK